MVVNQGSNQVTIIDIGSKSVAGTVGVGSRPSSVAFSPDGSRAYVANLWAGNVSVIDMGSKSVVGTFDAGSGPSGIAVAQNGRIYVSNQYSNSLTVHEPSGKIVGTVGGFSFPNWVALTPNGARAFVTNGNAGTVSVIDTGSNSVIGSIGVASLPTSVALAADGGRAFVTNEYGFSVSVIDVGSNSVVNTVSRVGVYPVVVALAPGAPVASIIAPPPPPPTAPVCNYSVSAGNTSFSVGGGSGTVNVNAGQGCGWSASSNNTDWISIGSSNGSGASTVNFSVAANGSQNGRSGSLTIAGQTVTITQTGIACSYVLSANSAALNPGGSNGSVNLNAPSGCAWSVSSDAGWLSITSATSGSGSATIGFAANSNSGTTGRSANLNIGGQNFNVSQGGVSFSPIRVSCGGPAITDGSGNVWAADEQRSRSISMAPVGNTQNPALYQKEAWSTGTLQYQFTVPNGNFSVDLHFAEIYHTQVGQRVFDIVINGQTMRPGFDILSQVTPNNATVQSFSVNVNNGQINIQLIPRTGTPKISGIEIR